MGYESVKAFAEKGAEVILASRWVEKGEAVPAAYMPEISVPRAEEPVVRLHHNTKDMDWTATDLYTGMVFDAKPLNESIMQSLLYAHFLREFQITIDDDETT